VTYGVLVGQVCRDNSGLGAAGLGPEELYTLRNSLIKSISKDSNQEGRVTYLVTRQWQFFDNLTERSDLVREEFIEVFIRTSRCSQCNDVSDLAIVFGLRGVLGGAGLVVGQKGLPGCVSRLTRLAHRDQFRILYSKPH